MKKIEGILLSAGESRRMGSPKALLKLGGRTVIEILSDEYLNSDLNGLTVVLGAYAEEIKKVLREKFPNVNIAINNEYKKEMFSSIQKGFSSIEKCDGVLIGLVDHPFIDRTIINKIISEFNGENIVIPVYKERKGHPVLLPYFLKEEILSKNPMEYSLRDIMREHRDIIDYVEVNTDKILFDMDTKERYERAKELWKK